MPKSVTAEITKILTTCTGIPEEAVDDVIDHIQEEIDSTFAGENQCYTTPEEVLADYFIPAAYLWAFCTDV